MCGARHTHAELIRQTVPAAPAGEPVVEASQAGTNGPESTPAHDPSRASAEGTHDSAAGAVLTCVAGIAMMVVVGFGGIDVARNLLRGTFSGNTSGKTATAPTRWQDKGRSGVLYHATRAYVADVEREVGAAHRAASLATESGRPDLAAAALRRASSAIRRIDAASVDATVQSLGSQWAALLDDAATWFERTAIAEKAAFDSAVVSGAAMSAGVARENSGLVALGFLGFLATLAQSEANSTKLRQDADDVRQRWEGLSKKWMAATAAYR
ncbi:MAG: hypothetical protein D6725_07040 [Planctomycetota bacterium]|nr:MAG: hypothetical protein D6725_07040 [Planctomycetota bacterium]